MCLSVRACVVLPDPMNALSAPVTMERTEVGCGEVFPGGAPQRSGGLPLRGPSSTKSLPLRAKAYALTEVPLELVRLRVNMFSSSDGRGFPRDSTSS
jgi:hypothetical protein